MKLTEEEDQLLKQYLLKILKYRETYDELYDHIITALSHKTTITSFEETIADILTDDFGGYDNLTKLEKAYKKVAVRDTVRLFLIYFIGYFKFPKLLFTVAGIVMIYYFTQHVQLKESYLSSIGLAMACSPWIYYGAKRIKLQKENKKAGHVFNPLIFKPTSNEYLIYQISCFPICFWVGDLFNSWNRYSNKSGPIETAFCLIIFALYALSLMKLYRDSLARIRTDIILITDKFLHNVK